MDKQDFALVKAMKDFRVYISHSHIAVFLHNVVVKEILTQDDPEGRRGKWIIVILEYDVEINPTKLIKGHGLDKIMAKSNLHTLDINFISTLSEDNNEEVA